MTHQSRSDVFPKLVRPVSPKEHKLKNPKLARANKLETWWNLDQKETYSQKVSQKTRHWPNRLDRFIKPARFVLLGQLRKNSNFTLIDLPIRFMDSSETLGTLGEPHGKPLAKNSCPKTHWIKRDRKSTTKNTSPQAPLKTTKTNAFPRDLRGKITRKRGTPTSCVIPNTNPTMKLLQILPTKLLRKSSENH
jgi:hypothetical protein